ncbi:MAG: ATP-binding protein [Burkholderiaceae bacterium]|nr:ATP-binding protein [Burkholderiaceae bacterium]
MPASIPVDPVAARPTAPAEPGAAPDDLLAQSLDLGRRLHAAAGLAEALALAAERLADRLGARRGVRLRVHDWRLDGVLLQTWPEAGSAELDCIDLDALVLADPGEPALGAALIGLQATLAGPPQVLPRRPWRPTQTRRLLVLPVGLQGRAVAALEFHDPVPPDPATWMQLELAGLQLGEVARREDTQRAAWLQAQQYGRLAMLASRTARGAVITDAEGVIEWAHPDFAELTGHPSAEVRGRPLWEVLVRDADDLRPAQLLRARFGAGSAFRLEFLARRGAVCLAPAEAYWLEVDAQLAMDESSGRLQYICLCKDVSERRLRQVGLDEGREILEALTDNLPISLVALDARDLQVISLNRHAELEFGASGDLVSGQPLTQALGPGLAELIAPQVREALRRRLPVEHEFRWRSVDGERVVAARHVAVGGHGGGARIVISQLRDVTQLRRSEQTLRESEQRYRELVESIDEGVFVADPLEGRCLYLSPRVLDMLGIDDLQALSADALLLSEVLEEDRPLLQAQRARELSLEPSDVTVRMQHPRRGLRWLRRRTRTLALPDGGLRVYGLLDDVTQAHLQALQLQAARDAAEAASLAKGRFLATMSHEIRTPMNGILGMTELLLDSALGERQRRFAEAVYRSGEHLLEILNDVLDFAKIESGRLELRPAPVALRPLVQDLLELMAPRAQAKGLQLHFEADPALPGQVSADALRLRQVLANLVGNAIKFTDRGEVRVALGLAEPAVCAAEDRLRLCCRVHDTGIGIAAAELPRLFAAFVQLHEGMARRHGGSGLGLAISRQLVELMGGQFTVHSQPGQGSTFGFTFEVGRLASPGPDLPALSAAPQRVAQVGVAARVLVVEDHPVNQEVMAQMLRRCGAQVQVCASAVEGLQALEGASFDLVLMDIQMPGMDGIEALRQLQASAGNGRPVPPVVAVTAHTQQGDEAHLLGLGFVAYLPKPFRMGQLLALLQRLLPAAVRPQPSQACETDVPAQNGEGLPLLDPAALQRLRQLDPEGQNHLVERVLAAFDASVARDLLHLAQARAGGDVAALQRIAHTLKSSAANVGALRLSEDSRECDRRLRAGESVEALAPWLDRLQLAMGQARDALRALLPPDPMRSGGGSAG